MVEKHSLIKFLSTVNRIEYAHCEPKTMRRYLKDLTFSLKKQRINLTLDWNHVK